MRCKGGLREVSAPYLPKLSPVFMRHDEELGRLRQKKINNLFCIFSRLFVTLDKVSTLGKAKINKIYFVFCSRFSNFAINERK